MDLNEIWRNVLGELQVSVTRANFVTWFKNTFIYDYKKGIFTIGVPNFFYEDWLKKHHIKDIQMALAHQTNEPVTALKFKVANPAPDQIISFDKSKVIHRAVDNSTSKKEVTKLQSLPKNSSLNDYYKFENFVVGPSNQLAYATAEAVAKKPGKVYNPLFIYGCAGLGKTHLIHAIGNQILEEAPEKVVRYVHAEDYYSDVVRAYQTKSFDSFKRYYRSLDVLLLDDVQFFNGKNRTQEEFFFVFNALIEVKKQIVISCDTYPKDISGLEDRLITRFDWGLTVQIEPPEIEMRVAILKKKAEVESVELDDEVAFYIAKHLRTNVRELEGALKKVLAYASFHRRKIDLDLAKESLKDLIGAVNRQITVENIQKTVSDYFKIKVSDLFSRKRTRQIARPRQVAMWLAKNLTSQSYPSIGEAFGGRDHTTVLHAVRTIEILRSRDNELNHDVHVLLQVLKG